MAIFPTFRSGPGRGEGLKRFQVSGIYRWLDQLFGDLLVPTNQRIQKCYSHATTMEFLRTPIVQALLYQNGSSSKRTPIARCTASGSFRDRLRAVECPIELTDALGGWSTDGIGAAYGQGYSLQLKQKWLSATVFKL